VAWIEVWMLHHTHLLEGMFHIANGFSGVKYIEVNF